MVNLLPESSTAGDAGASLEAQQPAAGRGRKAERATQTKRTHDPARTVADILAVATHEFAERGLAGARIDAIAAAMRTSKRMIYYYFGSKDGLYLAVLEEAYRRIRAIEADLKLQDLPPADALRRLVVFTLDYQFANPDFVRLVATENIHRGQYLQHSKMIRELNVPAIAGLREVYERGVRSGAFRSGLDAVQLHWAISAFAIFNVANQHTFSLIFQVEGASASTQAQRRELAAEMVLRYVSV